jgi:small subunit ribosomal protein S2
VLEAGVHFGHQTRRWNPKMKPYIFQERNGIYIIDLQKTVLMLREVYAAVKQMARDGKVILYVGTKKQAQDVVKEEAERAGTFFVNERWLGGTLTNFATIQKRIARCANSKGCALRAPSICCPRKKSRGSPTSSTSSSAFWAASRTCTVARRVFIVDPKKERIAVLEARKLKIPIIAVIDTNCDPDEIDYPIPGNDDAIRAVKLMVSKISDAIIEGRTETRAAASTTKTTKTQYAPEPPRNCAAAPTAAASANRGAASARAAPFAAPERHVP